MLNNLQQKANQKTAEANWLNIKLPIKLQLQRVPKLSRDWFTSRRKINRNTKGDIYIPRKTERVIDGFRLIWYIIMQYKKY